jgi:hypothetical protein
MRHTRHALNHYTQVTTPGFAAISGAAWATTAVTVNGGATDRKGEFFHREISVANSGLPACRGASK